MTYALLNGKLIEGHMRPAIGIGRLTGVATGEPSKKVLLDEPDPHTGWRYRWVKPMRPPTEQEKERWVKDTFLYGEDEVAFLSDVTILDTETIICGGCEHYGDAVKGDFLCVECRYEH